MSLDEAPGGEGRLGHYRVSVESSWDRHRGGRRGDQREPQIPLVGVIISILSGGLVLALGRQGRSCWRRPRGGRPAGRPPVSWLVHSPGSGRRAQLPEERFALRIEPSRRLQVRQRPLLCVQLGEVHARPQVLLGVRQIP